MKRFDFIYLPVLGIALLIALWWLACIVFAIPTVVLPSPVRVWNAFTGQFWLLMREARVTLLETVLGFLLALVIGLPMAVAIVKSTVLDKMFYPLLVALQTVPKVALAPIVLVWLGTGMASKLAIVWLVAFFPIIVDTIAGLRATPRDLIDLGRSLQASSWQMFVKVQLPSAMPHILTGAKVAITLSAIGAVIGEFMGASEGLGFLLLSATSQLNTPLAFAALIMLALLGLAVYGVVVLAEKWLLRWAPKHEHV